MKRRRVLWMLGSCLLLAGSGCPRGGAGIAGSAERARAFDARRAVPAGVVAVAWLDVPTLLARPGLKQDTGVVQQLSDRIRTQIGIDPALLRDATLFYSPIANESLPRRGAAIIPQALRDSPGMGKLGASELHGAQPIFRLGESATVTFLDRATIVGDSLSVRAALDAHAGKVAALLPGDALWKMLAAMPSAPVRLAFQAASLRPLLERLTIPGLERVEAVGVVADVAPTTLTIEVRAESSDPETLMAALRKLQAAWTERLSKSSFFKMFSDLLAGVRIESRGGTTIGIAASIPIDLVRSMLPSVMGSLGL
jgi:hypothetical protein